MKVNELMIGDILKCNEFSCSGHRVEYISEMDCEIGADGELYSLDHLFPIPLTYEILKKNGWKDAEFCCEYQDGNTFIQAHLPDMRGRINGVEIEYFQCEYVHQYQHLLRLCGLDKLADNFEV